MTIESALNKVSVLKLELDKLMPLSSEAEEKLWQKFRLEWNYNSNHMEGNTLTYGETQMLLYHDKAIGDHEMRDYEEMSAHDAAITYVKSLANDAERDLTESIIRQLNQIILVKPFWKEALTPQGDPTRKKINVGEYKKEPNHVRLKTGALFRYATPEETPVKMKELMDFYNIHNKSSESHPVWLAAMFHHNFTLIHPFDDGNGRVGRLVLNYMLIKNGYPPLIIKSNQKENYLTALQKADAGDHESFVIYICNELIWSLELSLKAAKGESLEEDDDLEKEFKLWKQSLSNKKIELKERSKEAIVSVYHASIRPLLLKYVEKFDLIRELFKEVIFHNNINVYQFAATYNRPLSVIDTFVDNLEGKYSTDQFPHLSNENLEKISILMHFKGFQNNGPNVFDKYFRITIEFEQYHYNISEINGYHDSISRNLYTHTLSNKEINDIVNKLLKKAFDEIKASTNRN